MLTRSIVAIATIVALCNAAPANIKHVVHEERAQTSSKWIKTTRIEGSAILPIRIGLTQSNLEKGHDFLLEVSDPASPNFGQYWSPDEVHEMFAPSDDAVAAVKEWLTTSGIDNSRILHYENRGWLAFDASVDEAERLLVTEFYEHENEKSGRVRVGCDKYHVPEHIQHHVDYITPGVKLTPVVKRSVLTKRGSRNTPKRPLKYPFSSPPPLGFPWSYRPPGAGGLPQDLQGCGTNMTPTCIRALYSIPSNQKAVPGNSLGLYEQGDYFAKSDVDLFFKYWAPWVPQGTYPIPALIDGAIYSVEPGDSQEQGEADIDIDIAQSLIYPQNLTLYQVDDINYAAEDLAKYNLWNTFLDAVDGSYCSFSAYGETGDDPSIDPIYPDPQPGGYKGQRQCGVYKLTPVVSMSYGEQESDLPINYERRQCQEFMKLGLQGHTFLVASGDVGVENNYVEPCLGPEQKIFAPGYPDNCPYITSVGGTMIYPDQTVYDAESAMDVTLPSGRYTSSGGFSNYYPRPSWQDAAVEHYFQTANPPYPYYSEINPNFTTVKGLYNRIGRAMPDVAANGASVPDFIGGTRYHEYGTSLSAPLFGSILTLINEERAAVGKGPVGFVSPTLYAHPEVLNDITNGTNLGCGTNGFQAVRGWDPVTGLGTPNFPKMKALWLSLP